MEIELTQFEIKFLIVYFNASYRERESGAMNSGPYRAKSKRPKVKHNQTNATLFTKCAALGYVTVEKDYVYFTKEGVEFVKVHKSLSKL